LWDVNSGTSVADLTGHEDVVTNVSVHPTDWLIATASKDHTFRLWDFRQPGIHEVSVFQGHEDSVTSAVFADGTRVLSSSDDRTIKVRTQPSGKVAAVFGIGMICCPVVLSYIVTYRMLPRRC